MSQSKSCVANSTDASFSVKCFTSALNCLIVILAIIFVRGVLSLVGSFMFEWKPVDPSSSSVGGLCVTGVPIMVLSGLFDVLSLSALVSVEFGLCFHLRCIFQVM